MAHTIKPYQPDLKKIAEQLKNPDPLILSPEEYEDLLIQYGLRRGTRLSDIGILKAMEAGLIKIWDIENNFDLEKQIQAASLDVRLGHEFWYFRQHQISRITMGQHMPYIKDLDLLNYIYRGEDEEFTFHSDTLVLAFSQESVSLSNAVVSSFDGRSLAGRLGISNHQTAGLIDPGFMGQIILEISNTNRIDVAVSIHERIGALSFFLLDQPSTRPRNLKTDSQSNAHKQVSPFGFRLSKWDEEKKRIDLDKNKNSRNNHMLMGDPLVAAQIKNVRKK